MTGRIPKAHRDELARISFAVMPKIGRRLTADFVKRIAGVSETTAQHIIRRGIHLAANQGVK